MPRMLVCVVVEDESARRMVCAALASLDVEMQVFYGADALLHNRDACARAACMVLNATQSGLDLQDTLNAIGHRASVLFLSGPCDVAHAIQALRNGALDFMMRPVDPVVLRERVNEAIALYRVRQARRARLQTLADALSTLTPREREVLDRVMEGRSNAWIARDLGISTKTVEQHRARMMDKMKAGSLAGLAAQVTEWRLLSEAARPGDSGVAGA